MTVALHVFLAEEQADPERLDVLTRQLQAEFLRGPVDDVLRPAGGEAPSGTRALDVATFGELLVILSGTATTLHQTLGTLISWLRIGPRTVRVEIDGDVLELTAATEANQDQIVRAFIQKHTQS